MLASGIKLLILLLIGFVLLNFVLLRIWTCSDGSFGLFPVSQLLNPSRCFCLHFFFNLSVLHVLMLNMVDGFHDLELDI